MADPIHLNAGASAIQPAAYRPRPKLNGMHCPQRRPGAPSVREARVQERAADTGEQRAGDDHARPQAAVRAADQAGHQEEERQANDQDRPPAEHLLVDAEASDETFDLLAGQQERPDDQQHNAGNELDRPTHARSVSGW